MTPFDADAGLDLPARGLLIPRWAMVAVVVVVALLSVGAAGGVRAYAVESHLSRSDSTMAQHLAWAEERSAVLSALGPTVARVDAKVDALTRLKCLEARDLPNLHERRQAIDRLVLSQIDCGDLVGNKVPAQ